MNYLTNLSLTGHPRLLAKYLPADDQDADNRFPKLRTLTLFCVDDSWDCGEASDTRGADIFESLEQLTSLNVLALQHVVFVRTDLINMVEGTSSGRQWLNVFLGRIKHSRLDSGRG